MAVFAADIIHPGGLSDKLRIQGVAWPEKDEDAVNKLYVDTHSGGQSLIADVPLVISPTSHISVNVAAGSNPGVISGTAQTLGGDVTFAGDVFISSDSTFDVTTGGTSHFYGNSTFSGDVNISGSMTSSGSDNFTGAVTVSGPSSSLTVASGSSTVIDSDMTVNGSSYFEGNVQTFSTVTMSGSVISTGGLTSTGVVVITGSSASLTLGSDSTATIAGDTYITGDLTVSGSSTVSGSVTMTGALVMTGGASSLSVGPDTPATFAGDTFLSGDATITSADVQVPGTITVTGSIEGPTMAVNTSDNHLASTEYVQKFSGNYEASNGWIEGGKIVPCDAFGVPVPASSMGTNTSLSFYVESLVVRFISYSQPAQAEASIPATMFASSSGHSQIFTVVASETSWTIISVFAKRGDEANVYKSQGPYKTSLLYDDKVQLGILYLKDQGGSTFGITGVSQIKWPVANRSNLLDLDMMSTLAPINRGVFSIDRQTDLSLVIGSGVIWYPTEQINTYAWDPNNITVTGKTATEPMDRVWFDGTDLQYETANVLLDLSQYNPGGNSATLQSPTLPTNWCNVSILYSLPLNKFIMQYPTEEFSNENDALLNAGKFKRLHSTLLSTVNTIGIITVQFNNTDLSLATIGPGEFFNYNIGTGYQAGGGGGGGSTQVLENNTAFVDPSPIGSPTGVVGHMELPFDNITHATAPLALFCDASHPGLIHVSAGLHTEDNYVTLTPFVAIAGWGLGSTEIKLQGAVGPGPNFVVGTDWGSSGSSYGFIGRCSMRNLRLISSGMNIDLYNDGTGDQEQLSSLFDLYDSEVEGPFYFVARSFSASSFASQDYCRLICVQFYSNAEFNGGINLLNNVIMETSDTITFTSDYSNNLSTVIGCFFGNVVVENGASGATVVKISSSIISGSLTVNVGAVLSIDRASLAAVTSIVNNGTISVYDDDVNQSNIVYFAAAGNDETTSKLHTGLTLNAAVKTLTRAVAIAGAPTSAAQVAIVCGDAEQISEDATIPSYAALRAQSAVMSASTLTMSSNSSAQVGECISTSVVLTDDTRFECKSFEEGLITVTASSANVFIDCDTFVKAVDNTTVIISCGTGCSNVFVRAASISGRVFVDANSTVDLTECGDITDATFAGTGTVLYPVHYDHAIAATTGLMKNNARGVLYVASAGTDYMAAGQIFTGTGDVTGTGALTSPVTLSIGNNKVVYSMIQTLPAMSLIGNTASQTSNATSVSVASSNTINAVVLRNSEGSFYSHRSNEDYSTVAAPAIGSTSSLHSSDGAIIVLNGTGGGTVRLPPNSEIQLGFKQILYNDSSAGVTVKDSLELGLSELLGVGEGATFYYVGGNSWFVIRDFQSITLTGAVTGSVAPSANVSITTAFGNVSGPTVMGNTSAGLAAPSPISLASTALASSVTYRDASSNSFFNHVSEAFATASGNATTILTAASVGFLELTGTGTGVVKLPATAGLITGFSYRVYNKSNGTVAIRDSTSGLVSTLLSEDRKLVTWDGAAWLVVPEYPTVTLTGAVTGSVAASSALTITTALAAVPVSSLGSIASPTVLGNISGSNAVPTTITASATSAANSVVIRDASSNSLFQHVSEAVATALGNASTVLTATSGGMLILTGTGGGTVRLPATAALSPGFAQRIYNNSNQTVNILNSTATAVATMQVNDMRSFVFDNSTPWFEEQQYPDVTLTGAVTGSVAGSSALTITTALAAVPISSLGSIASPNVLGNISGGNAVPYTIPAYASASATSVALRDTYANSYFHSAIQSYYTQAANSSTSYTMTNTSPTTTVITGAANQTMRLPAIPDASAIPGGTCYRVINTCTGTVTTTVQDSAGNAVASLGVGVWGDFESNGSTWLVSTRNFSTVQVFNISTYASMNVLGGQCATSDTTWTTLISTGLFSTSCAVSCTYDITVLHSSSASVYGQMTGAFRAYFSAAGTAISISTPFTTDIKTLESALAACTMRAFDGGSRVLQIQVQGIAGTTLKWGGEAHVVMRTLNT